MSSAGDCCPAGSCPSLVTAEEHVQLGRTMILGDLPVYVVGPAPSLTAVVVSYDIYGFNGGRIRNICDHLAQDGHLVVLPDYFRGDCWTTQREETELPMKMDWIRGVSDPKSIRKDLVSCIVPYLRSQGVARLAYLGFCFGGYVTFIGCQEENVSCGVGIHSSIKIFNFHNSTETEAAASLRCPQMLLQASNDPDNTKQGGDVYAVLQSLPIGGACVMREFPQVQHGWVPRGDLSDPVVSQNVRAAMDLSRAFLNEHLRSETSCCCPIPLSG